MKQDRKEIALPSLEGCMALVHVTPKAKGMATVMPVNLIRQQNSEVWLKGCPDLYCSCTQQQN